MPTMTAEALTSEIDTRTDRIRELTTTAEALEASLASSRNAIASAIAGGAAGSGSTRETVRANSEELAGVKDAIDQLTRERVSLEAQLKVTEKREASERADQTASEAARAIGAVHAALRDAAERILVLRDKAQRKIDASNHAEQVAKSLNGQPFTGILRSDWHARPGLRDLLHEIDSYVHHQDVGQLLAAQRVVVDKSDVRVVA